MLRLQKWNTDSGFREFRASVFVLICLACVFTNATRLAGQMTSQRMQQSVGGYGLPSPQSVITSAEPQETVIQASHASFTAPDFGYPPEVMQEHIVVQEQHVQRGSNTPQHTRFMYGVDGASGSVGLEPKWRDSSLIPWENYSYGEYIGPSRTPHVPAYRLRVDDQIEFVFQVTRESHGQSYRLSPGDSIRVTSPVDARLNQASLESGITIMPDGTVSLDLIGNILAAGKTVRELKAELDMLYSNFYDTQPKVVVAGLQTGTRLRDFLDSIDARAGAGGLSRQVSVNPDGTIRLPLVGTVGVVGLTLDELEREINMQYAQKIQGLRVTPILAQRAPRFIYVTGQVANPGRFALDAPTTTMQAIALAGGWNNGGNIRQIVVFRRDQNWRLMALRLDLAGGLLGKRPIPSDEIWLRDSDIVLIPKTPVRRLADAIELYFTRTLYGVFPSELGVFDAQAIGGIQP